MRLPDLPGSRMIGGRRGLSSGAVDQTKEAKRSRISIDVPIEYLKMPLREDSVQALFEVLRTLASSIDGYASIPSVQCFVPS